LPRSGPPKAGLIQSRASPWQNFDFYFALSGTEFALILPSYGHQMTIFLEF